MLAPLVSCSNNQTDDGGNETDNSATTTLSENVETVEETTEEDILAELMADVPKDDYAEYDFVMLNNTSNFALTAMTAEEITGEAINDAIYNRNIKVAEDLNINISEELIAPDAVTKNMNTAIAAGDDAYDCFWSESTMVAPIAIAGNLLNVHEIAPINLEKPWWNGEALKDIEVGGYQYFLVGDLHLMFKESFWMVGFNKNIIDENGLEDPYQTVREGTWTLDEMKKYMSTVAMDLNGDGVMDGNDRFGVTCYNGCVTALFTGCDGEFVVRDSEGIPQFVDVDDKFNAIYEKIVATMFDPSTNYTCMDGKTQNIAQYTDGWHGVFSSGHALFYLEPIGSLKKLRDMDAEFGIIPYPKFDESQSDYHTYIACYAALCGIPITAEDPARTGTILENLCAQSYGELRSAYIDTTLNFKYIRDAESSEMLNLILSTGRFCLSDQLGANGPKDTFTSNVTTGAATLTSSYAKIMNASKKNLDKNVKKLMKIAD